MSDNSLKNLPGGFKGMSQDMGSDQTAFKGVQWGKVMMWIFLLSDTFIFSCFLISYMKGRTSTVVDWPNTSEVFFITCQWRSCSIIINCNYDICFNY
jgi:cytochrome c oxidase subunit 3